MRRDGAAVDLTPNEYKLLTTLARYPGRVYSRFELVNRVLGYDFEGYERTIDVHVKNLRKKIEPDAAHPRYIETVIGGRLQARQAVRRRLRWDLRARLVVAFVGVALLAAVLATVYSSVSMDAHVAAAAQARLQRSATHFGDVAAVVYEQNQRLDAGRRHRAASSGADRRSSRCRWSTTPGARSCGCRPARRCRTELGVRARDVRRTDDRRE